MLRRSSCQCVRRRDRVCFRLDLVQRSVLDTEGRFFSSSQVLGSRDLVDGHCGDGANAGGALSKSRVFVSSGKSSRGTMPDRSIGRSRFLTLHFPPSQIFFLSRRPRCYRSDGSKVGGTGEIIFIGRSSAPSLWLFCCSTTLTRLLGR